MNSVRQMWPDGPFRNFSSTPIPGKNWMSLANGGYAGAYVCAQCRKNQTGVYQTPDGWFCSKCRRNAKFNRLEGKATV